MSGNTYLFRELQNHKDILVSKYYNFLFDKYRKKIRDRDKDQPFFVISLIVLRRHSPELAIDLLQNARPNTTALSTALNKLCLEVDKREFLRLQQDQQLQSDRCLSPPQRVKAVRLEPHFIGYFGKNNLRIREISASYNNKLIKVHGLVSTVGTIQTKLLKSVHYNPKQKQLVDRYYFDNDDPRVYYLTTDTDGTKLQTEFGLSQFIDVQKICIQEILEDLKPGAQPRSINVLLEGSLVNTVSPGQNICLVGVYQNRPAIGSKSFSFFEKIILAKSVSQQMRQSPFSWTSLEDIRKVTEILKKRKINLFELLTSSIAPSIKVQDTIKKGLLCQLISGEQKVVNSTRLRGRLNILLIGDPGVGKSQLLRFVHQISPRGLLTSGRNSSSVGLTASITKDESGESVKIIILTRS